MKTTSEDKKKKHRLNIIKDHEKKSGESWQLSLWSDGTKIDQFESVGGQHVWCDPHNAIMS